MTVHAPSAKWPFTETVLSGAAEILKSSGLLKTFQGIIPLPEPTGLAPTFESTEEVADYYHRGEGDNANDLPYYTHPLAAARIFQEDYERVTGGDAPENEIFAVMLHDVIESKIDRCINIVEANAAYKDTLILIDPINKSKRAAEIVRNIVARQVRADVIEDLERRFYDDRTIEIVSGLTKLPRIGKGLETKEQKLAYTEEYIKGIAATGDVGLILAKMSDAKHNLQRQMSGELARTNPERFEKVQAKHKETVTILASALDLDPEEEILSAIGPETGYMDFPSMSFTA